MYYKRFRSAITSFSRCPALQVFISSSIWVDNCDFAVSNEMSHENIEVFSNNVMFWDSQRLSRELDFF